MRDFVRQVPSARGPFLIAQCWSRVALSDIKLSPLYDGDAPVPEVVILHHLGLEDERVVRVGWWDLDRTLEPDHLTSLFIPEALRSGCVALRDGACSVDLVDTLRAQCPWDRAQTHSSLMPHLLEESYEVLDALRELAATPAPTTTGGVHGDHLREELGDLLFQIVFHARLAQEEGLFTLADVARGVHDKLVHRHPHVFADTDASSTEQVVANWEEIEEGGEGSRQRDRGHTHGSACTVALHEIATEGHFRRPARALDAPARPRGAGGRAGLHGGRSRRGQRRRHAAGGRRRE